MLQNKVALTFKEVTCSTNSAGCNKNNNIMNLCARMKKKKDYTIEPILSLERESTITCQHNPTLSTLPFLIYSGVAA